LCGKNGVEIENMVASKENMEYKREEVLGIADVTQGYCLHLF